MSSQIGRSRFFFWKNKEKKFEEQNCSRKLNPDNIQLEFIKRASINNETSFFKLTNSNKASNWKLLKKLSPVENIEGNKDLAEGEDKNGERLLSYLYDFSIINEGRLPETELDLKGFRKINLERNETFVYSDVVVLESPVASDVGNRGIFRWFRRKIYGLRTGKWYVFPEENKGILLLTNIRLLFQSFGNHSPMSIPIQDVYAYRCFQCKFRVSNKRKRSYLFEIGNIYSVLIFEICLNYLLGDKITS
ncbi:hypothetical protein ACFLRM_00690 [Acidobacteriota bacterium]